MLDMILDDLLFAIILAGIAFSGAYLRAEALSHLGFKAAERRREALERELHNKGVRHEQMDMHSRLRTDPSSIQTDIFATMRALARASCIFGRERQFRLFGLVRGGTRQATKLGYRHAS